MTKERLYLESVERFLPAPKKIIMEGGDSKVLPLLPLTGMERLTTPEDPRRARHPPLRRKAISEP